MRDLLCMLATIAATAASAPPQSAPVAGSTPNTLTLPAGAPRPPARVADQAWLSGQWIGEGLGGHIDEVWSQPEGGAMVGYFRLVKDGKPVFYEIMTLLESEGSVEMRLKHVNPDMTGWEEKAAFVTFRLVKHDATGAYFSGLTFRPRGPRCDRGIPSAAQPRGRKRPGGEAPLPPREIARAGARMAT
jgi:hypothetical protein